MKSKYVLPAFFLLAGCTVVKTKPPFANPATFNDYATLVSGVSGQSEAIPIATHLFTVDGKYAVEQPAAIFDPDHGGHSVTEMKIIPGVHLISAGCVLSGMRNYISFEIKINLKPKTKYQIECSSNGQSKAKFEVFESETKSKVEYEFIKWFPS